MDDFCLEPGMTMQDVDAVLRELSLDEAQQVPVLALAVEPARRGRLRFANRSMLDLFGTGDLAALEARLARGDDPGMRRLMELAARLPLDGAPRLERLRFLLRPATRTLTFLCRKIGHAESALFVAAAIGLGMAAPRQSGTEAARGAKLEVAPQAAPLAALQAAPQAALQAPLAALLSVDALRQALAAKFGEVRTIRFLWRTDAEDRIVEVTPPLSEVVGAAADIVGRDFNEVVQSLALDPAGKLLQVFAKRESWSGLEVPWPVAGAAAIAPVSLGGLPAFDAERRFEGYRGFGVVHVDRLEAAVPRVIDGAHGRDADFAPPDAAEPGEHDNVVLLRPLGHSAKGQTTRDANLPTLLGARESKELSPDERSAFAEIGATLAAETKEAEPPQAPVEPPPAAPEPPANFADEIGRNALAIFDRLGFGILVSRNDVPIYANRHLLDLTGYADIDALHAAGGLLHLFDQPGGQAISVVTASGERVAVEARLQKLDWDALPATLLTLQRREADEQRPVLEAKLNRLENEARELNAILDTATDGLALIDSGGRILALNRSAEALFGYDHTEVAGEPLGVLLTQESDATAKAYLDGLKSNGVISLLNDGREIVGRARQGGEIPIFMTLGRISVGSGVDPADVKYCALLRDMTHWKKVEQELDEARKEAERASALKSDFLAKISHEIRTPLNAIIGFAEVIMDESFGPIGNERYKDYLKDIHTSGTHVMSLVNDLLDLSKIEAGKMDLDFVSVDVNRIVSECVSIMQPQASRERVIMRLSLAQRLPHVVADERSLRQIVLNLLSNAVKFNEPGGQVIVATALTDSGQAVIRIRDTGIGMSDQDITTALEPFRQLATSRPSTGTGLGLPLTKALVEANRAFFSLKSKKREGTLAEVVFPPARVLAA